MTDLSSFCPSEYAEEIFALLQEDGLKAQNHARTTMRTTNMDVLFRDGALMMLESTNTIGVHVDVGIARDKDQSLPHRVKLAEEVREIVENELQTKLNSKNQQEKPSPLLLSVRVVLLSDGSSLGRRFTAGPGEAKLTLAYCLQSRSSGQVGMANQLYATEDCSSADLDSYWEYSSAVVRSMARKLANNIADEVTTGIADWMSHRKENEERLEKIKVKLANEENLQPDEYAFAAENHIL